MEYNAIFTHNPQDFFFGEEPNELNIFETLSENELHKIAEYVNQGYYAIVSKKEV